MAKRILFIVEGERDGKYISSIARRMNLGMDAVPIRANIYMLYSKLKEDDFNVNITDVLLEMKGVSDVKNYKKIVGERGTPTNISKYTLETYKLLAKINIKKANFMKQGLWLKPSYVYYRENLGQEDIMESEAESAIKNGRIRTLSSAPLFMVDYWGNANGFYDSLFRD